MWPSFRLVKKDCYIDYTNRGHLSNHSAKKYECTKVYLSFKVRKENFTFLSFDILFNW